jgi:hypothetical protein
MGAPVLTYILKIAEANPGVLPNMDALSSGVLHAASKKALEDVWLAYNHAIA